MALSDSLKAKGLTGPIPQPLARKAGSDPVWRGPEVDGITYSLLCRFLTCRERFRLLVVEGLTTADRWNHRLGYGEMWHLCEEAFAAGEEYLPALVMHVSEQCRRYPLQQVEIDHWYNVCKVQFPIYIEYWEEHANVEDWEPLLQEYAFNVPYRLPSGRTVRLRGKFDSVDLRADKDHNYGVWLQENKTKSDIHEEQIRRQLNFDLQTMIYMVALETLRKEQTTTTEHFCGAPLRGVRYNVVRRPLSGGKGSIVRHKPTKSNPEGESKEHYYDRLSAIIGTDPGPGYFFMRWNVEVAPADITRFRRECLDPILENLCDWWSVLGNGDPFIGSHIHWRHPYGVWNPLDEGYATDMDEYLATGSEVGLERTANLFPEL